MSPVTPFNSLRLPHAKTRIIEPQYMTWSPSPPPHPFQVRSCFQPASKIKRCFFLDIPIHTNRSIPTPNPPKHPYLILSTRFRTPFLLLSTSETPPPPPCKIRTRNINLAVLFHKNQASRSRPVKPPPPPCHSNPQKKTGLIKVPDIAYSLLSSFPNTVFPCPTMP